MTGHVDISVGPGPDGWAVVSEALSAPVMFQSGGRAEAHARALAKELSDAGHHVHLRIHDRSQALIGASRYHARDLEPV